VAWISNALSIPLPVRRWGNICCEGNEKRVKWGHFYITGCTLLFWGILFATRSALYFRRKSQKCFDKQLELESCPRLTLLRSLVILSRSQGCRRFHSWCQVKPFPVPVSSHWKDHMTMTTDQFESDYLLQVTLDCRKFKNDCRRRIWRRTAHGCTWYVYMYNTYVDIKIWCHDCFDNSLTRADAHACWFVHGHVHYYIISEAAIVEVHSLVSAPQYNGLQAQLIAYLPARQRSMWKIVDIQKEN